MNCARTPNSARQAGNLLYSPNVQTVAVPKPRKISLPRKARCDGTFPTRLLTAGTTQAAERVGVRVCCVYVSVCLYLERVSVKSKGPNHTRCGTENQQRQSGQPHPGSMHWKW